MSSNGNLVWSGTSFFQSIFLFPLLLAYEGYWGHLKSVWLGQIHIYTKWCHVDVDNWSSIITYSHSRKSIIIFLDLFGEVATCNRMNVFVECGLVVKKIINNWPNAWQHKWLSEQWTLELEKANHLMSEQDYSPDLTVKIVSEPNDKEFGVTSISNLLWTYTPCRY